MRQADSQLQQKREASGTADSLIELNAMIAQAQNLRRVSCQRLAALVPPVEGGPSAQTAGERVASLRREELSPPRRLRSKEEVNQYVEAIREKLLAALAEGDAVQIG